MFEGLGGRKATFFIAVVILLIVIELLKKYGVVDLGELRNYLVASLGIYTAGNVGTKIGNGLK